MKISIFGTGYVGLVTGACLAELGHHVTCIDIDQKKIDALNNHHITIYEPGLNDIVINNNKEGNLFFTTEPEAAINDNQLIFIAVGTPQDENGAADLKYVYQVAKTIGQLMTKPKIIITKSTIPVGTNDKVKEIIEGEFRTVYTCSWAKNI